MGLSHEAACYGTGGPGASTGPLVGKVESWGLATGPRDPRAAVGLLVGGACS